MRLQTLVRQEAAMILSSSSLSKLHFHHIHKKKRNRLEAAGAKQLVYVFTSLRFLQRAQQIDLEKECWSWEQEDQPEEAG